MKFVRLYTGEDSESHFQDVQVGVETLQPLGSYSKKFPVADLMFREFEAGNIFDWHPAPQSQYIIYLEGCVEVEVSNGEKRTFNAGDVLFADDLTGKGHVSRTLTKGRSIIVTVNTIMQN